MPMSGSPAIMHSPNPHPNQIMNNSMMMSGPRVNGPMGPINSQMIANSNGQQMHSISGIIEINIFI